MELALAVLTAYFLCYDYIWRCILTFDHSAIADGRQISHILHTASFGFFCIEMTAKGADRLKTLSSSHNLLIVVTFSRKSERTGLDNYIL